MYSKTLACCFVFISLSCKNNDSPVRDKGYPATINELDKTISSKDENPFPEIAAIPLPPGYSRMNQIENSFPKWLERVRLKKSKTVYLYDGTKKSNQSAQFAVLDIPVGSKNLQQCADAIMRLRASYLFDKKKYDSIVFYDNNGKPYRFTVPYSSQHLNEYLETVFGMCGTASLSKQLQKVDYNEIQPGDVLIRGGFPGHAVIVMDMAVNKNGNKKYMLAQSYMPAQDIHVLLNPSEDNSPWYEVNDDDIITTPEYTFYSFELKRW